MEANLNNLGDRRKTTLLALLLTLPTLVVGQSFSEVAKKEKERRKKNKKQGTTVHVLSKEDLYPGGRPETGDEDRADGTAGQQASSDDGGLDLEDFEEGEDLPDSIPPDAPLPQKLRMFELLKREYERQVQEIGQSIAENRDRLCELEVQISATSRRLTEPGPGFPSRRSPERVRNPSPSWRSRIGSSR
jgi:hypothetical protein